MKNQKNIAVRVLHSLGCDLVSIEQSKHYKARFLYNGTSRMLVFSGTSRDPNLERKMVQDVKNIIRKISPREG